MKPDPAHPPFGTVDHEYAVRLATTPPDEDGPVWMINLMKYRERAEYLDGRETTLSGREADDAYAPVDVLAEIGAEVVFFGDVEVQLLGDAPTWDRIGVVKYPTRRSFIEMQRRPDFLELYPHKEAGMEQTFVIGGQPFAPPPIPVDLPDWSEVPHPPTAEDGDVMVIHVLRFNEGGAETDMVEYQNAAGAIAIPYGARPAAWFEVEGTIIGDGRGWDQVRFNHFPSMEAFMAVALHPDRVAPHQEHREPAIADTYTVVVRPQINTIAASVR
ncbi:hypothetical protein [Nocardioides sp.]|uniref:hypothetical protein n=1 Tax=Nocardioides sp. TaxID=35761 RepID=UPI003784F30A